MGEKVKWLIENEKKYFFFVPIGAFVLGSALAYGVWHSFRAGKKIVI